MNALAAVADAADGNDPEPVPPAVALAHLLKLSDVGRSIVRATIHGRGSKASADVILDDGTVIEFAELREVANPQKLMVEVIATTGAMPKLKAPDAHLALRLLRDVADHQDVLSQDDISTDIGMTYLQSAQVIDLNMGNREERWSAFSYLNGIHPSETARLEGRPYATACYTLRDIESGNSYVRCGWFYAHAKEQDRGVSQAELAHRMERVGWQRRGRRGAIKASAPARDAFLSWSFYVIADQWNDSPSRGQSGCAVVAGYTPRAHATDTSVSRVGATTSDNQNREE